MKKRKDFNGEIARIAYELFEKRGGVHGYDYEDWLEAERIVMAMHAQEIENVARAVKARRTRKSAEGAKPKPKKTAKAAAEAKPRTTRKKSTPKSKTK